MSDQIVLQSCLHSYVAQHPRKKKVKTGPPYCKAIGILSFKLRSQENYAKLNSTLQLNCGGGGGGFTVVFISSSPATEMATVAYTWPCAACR